MGIMPSPQNPLFFDAKNFWAYKSTLYGTVPQIILKT